MLHIYVNTYSCNMFYCKEHFWKINIIDPGILRVIYIWNKIYPSFILHVILFRS